MEDDNITKEMQSVIAGFFETKDKYSKGKAGGLEFIIMDGLGKIRSWRNKEIPCKKKISKIFFHRERWRGQSW